MIALIARATRFSPNSEVRDAAILNAVAAELRARGHSCTIWEEEKLPSTPQHWQAALSMARSLEALQQLAQWENDGLPILNSPTALLHCTRSKLDKIALRGGSRLPSLANTTDLAQIEQAIGYPLWLKRGDAAAQSVQEVQYINSREDLLTVLPRFSDYPDFTLTAHAEGQLLKFYGVAHTHFFHVAPPAYSKFGLEHHNSPVASLDFSGEALQQLAQVVAAESGLTIYGGDAIVREDGSFAIIDFNDWPSFSSCVSPAASAIVECLLLQL